MNRLNLRYILCPVDLSSLSINSLEWANAIARARSAELRALQVIVTEGLVAPEPLGSLERGDMMMKLRERSPLSPPTMSILEQLSGKGIRTLEIRDIAACRCRGHGSCWRQRPTRPMGSLTTAVVARCDCQV